MPKPTISQAWRKENQKEKEGKDEICLNRHFPSKAKGKLGRKRKKQLQLELMDN